MRKIVSYFSIFAIVAMLATSNLLALQPPTQQAKYIGFTDIKSTEATVLVGLIGNGEGRIVVVQNTSTPDWTATDDAVEALDEMPGANSDWNAATQIGSTGSYIVADLTGTGSSVTITNLPTTPRDFAVKVYEYEKDALGNYDYNVDDATLNPRTFQTVNLLPPTSPSITPSIDGGTLTWNDADNATGYYLDVRLFNGAIVATYDLLDIGYPVSPSATYVITGLSMGTQYQVRLRSYDGSDISAATAWLDFTTLSDEVVPTLSSITAWVGSTRLDTQTPPAINEADAAGTDPFILKIVFNEEMNTNIDPTVTINGSAGGTDLFPALTPTLTFAFGYWTTTNVTNDTYVMEYTITDNNVEDTDFNVTISNAPKDKAGNAFVPGTPDVADLFDVDLKAPQFSNESITTLITCLSADDDFVFSLNIADGTNGSGVNSTGIVGSPALKGGTNISQNTNTWTYTYTVDAIDTDGDYEITVNVSDQAGNTNSRALSTTPDFTVDNTKPVVTASVDKTCVNEGTELTFTVTVEEDGCGDIQDSNIEFIATPEPTNGQPHFDGKNGNVLTYTYTIGASDNGDENGEYNIQIYAHDDAGNTSDNYQLPTITVDNTAPTVTATVDQTCVKEGTELTFEVTVVEDGCGTIEDSNIEFIATPAPTNGQPFYDGKTVSGNTTVLTYTYTVGPSDNAGDFDIDIYAIDDAGNESVHYELENITVDKTAPDIIDISVTDGCVMQVEGGEVEFTVSIVEEGCGTFDQNDVTVTAGTTNAPQFSSISGTGNPWVLTYTIDLDGADADGAYDIVVNATDDAGNDADQFTETGAFTVDNTAPTVVIAIADGDDCTTDADGVTFTVTVVEEGCGTYDPVTDIFTTMGSSSANDPVFVSPRTGAGTASAPWVYTYTIDVSSINGDTDTDYTISVEATDVAGNASGVKTATFTVDNTAPLVENYGTTDPTCLVTGDTFQFTFDVTEEGCGTFDADNLTVTAAIGAGTTLPVSWVSGTGGSATTTYTYGVDLTGAPDGDYDIVINATDAAGNTFEFEPEGNVDGGDYEFTIDNTSPLLTVVTSPAPFCDNAGSTVTFDITVDETGCGTFDASQIFISMGANPGSDSTQNEFTTVTGTYPNFSATLLIDAADQSGVYTVLVDATDDAGNHATQVSTTFKVDNTKPAVNTPSMTVGHKGCFSEGAEVQFTVTASDYNGCGTFGEGNIAISIESNGTPITGSITHTGQEGNVHTYKYTIQAGGTEGDQDGSYDITATVTDAAGNTNVAKLTGAFNIDNTAPTINEINVLNQPICASAAAESVVYFNVSATETSGCGDFDHTNFTITFSGDPLTQDNLAFIDEAPQNQYNWSYTIHPSDPTGEYDIVITATDDAGNSVTETETAAFKIDNTAPDVSVAVTPACVTGAGTVNITVVASDLGCGSFDETFMTVTTSGSLTNPLVFDNESPAGTYNYTLTIDALDAEGNYDIVVNATDGAGNTITPVTDAFGIDQTAPLISNLAVSPDPNCEMEGGELTFTFDIAEGGCSTFGVDEIDINITEPAPNTNGLAGVLSNVQDEGNGSYSVTYTVGETDITGTYTFSVDASDAAGNDATQQTIYFHVDTTPPVVNLLGGEQGPFTECLTAGETLTIEIEASDIGCGTFDENNLTIMICDHEPESPLGPESCEWPLTNAYSVTGNEDDTYTCTVLIDENDLSGIYGVAVFAQDDAGNTSSDYFLIFGIDNDAPVLSGLAFWEDEDLEGTQEVCLTGTDEVLIELTATDEHCGTFGATDLSLLVLDEGSNDVTADIGDAAALNFVAGPADLFGKILTLDGDEATGTYDIEVHATDSKGNTSSLGGITLNIDNTAPTVVDDVITMSGETCVMVGETINFSFDILDAGCGTFDHTNMNVYVVTQPAETLITATYVSEPDGGGSGIYTYTHTTQSGDTEGAYGITISANDSKGNTFTLPHGSIERFYLDKTAPTATINVPDAPLCLATGDDFTFSVEYVENGCGTFDAADISLTITTASGNTYGLTPASVSQDGKTFNYTYTVVSGDGTGAMTIAWSATDDAGNTNSGSDATLVDTDTEAPTLANLAVDKTCASAADEDMVTITFDASDNGCGTFDADNLTVAIADPNNDGLQGSTGTLTAGTSPAWSLTFAPAAGDETGEYLVTVEATDDAGNTASIGPVSFNVDNTAPYVVDNTFNLFAGSECITAGTRIDFTFEITEPGCGTIGPGQAKGEIKVQTSVPTDLGGNETHISGDGEGLYHYALIVPSNAPDGEHDITITLTDSKGNMNTFGFEDVFSVDNEPPVADNFQVDGGPCFRANQTVTFTFDVTEGGCGILDETNLDVSSTSANDPVYSSVSGDGTNGYVFTYTLDIAAADNGDYNLSVVVTDNAGNTFAFSPAGAEFTVDNTEPTLDTPMLSSTCLGASDPITIEFDAFDEGCGTFDENDITVTIFDPNNDLLTTISPVTLSAGSYDWEATYTLSASPANGTYTVQVTATDDAGNDATMTSAQFSVDTEAPTIDAITENIDCVGPGAEVEFTVTITEDGCGTFDRDDITVTIVGCENVFTATTTDLTEVSGTHTFTYTATLTEAPTCAYDIVVNVKDDEGNTNSDLVEAAFSVDADGPVLSNGDPMIEYCYTSGDNYTFEFDASDLGCGTFGQGDITVRVYYGESLFDTYSVVAAPGTRDWRFSLPITGDFDTGLYNVEVTAEDSFGNPSNKLEPTFRVDNTAPVIANLSPSDACLSSANEDTQTFTFTASDIGCYSLSTNNFTVTIEDPNSDGLNGSLSTLTEPSPDNFEFTYSPNSLDETGTYTIRINGQDNKGNVATELTGTFEVDNSAPDFDANDIVVVNDCVAPGSDVTIEVEITDDGCGTFGGANIYVNTGFGSAGDDSQDVDVFTFTVWVPETTATGNYDVTVDANDSKGNFATATATGVISVDADAPTLSSLDVSPDEVAPTEDVTISVDATDIGCGTFGAGDLTLTITPPSGSLNGTLSGPSVSGTTYTWVYTVTDPDAEGMYDVAVAATDGVGNSSSIGETGAFKVIYSTEPEVTSIVRKAGATNPTNAASVVYTVTFSENVSNVSDANFRVVFTGTATGTIDSFGPASGTTFDVTVSGITGEGTIRLDLDDIGTIEDDDSNPLVGTYNGDEVYTIDRVLPTIVSINRNASADNPTNASSVDFIVTFSEDVNGVATGAFSTSTTGTVGGSVTSVSANPGTEYVVTVTGITGDGTLTIDLDTPSGITDDVNNVMTDTRTGDEAYTIDNTLPTVDPVLDVTNPTTAVVLFSEDVDETLAETASNYALTSDDDTFTGQNPTSVVYDSGTNTATITLGTPNFGDMATDETVTVTVSNVADAAGNVVDPANDVAEFTNVLAPEKLVITTVIPSQATGTAFSFTVQSQTSGGSPAPVDQDTPLDITIATGTGTLSVSGTPTILNGSSSTNVTVTYTKAGGETGVSLTADNDGGMELTAGTSNTFSILAPEPTDQADGLFFVKVKKTSVEINWVRSTDAARSIVYMRQGNNSITSSNYPVDGDAYSASSVFGSGSNINGASVVYQGTDSVVTVTGLTRLTQYNVKVDAMNGTGTASNYLTSSSSANNKSFSTPYFKASDNNGSNMAGETIVVTNVYPNPATDQFVIDLSLAVETTFSIQLFNVDGNRVADLFTNETLGSGGHNLKVNLDNFQLSSGSYQMLMTTTNNEMMIIPITIVK